MTEAVHTPLPWQLIEATEHHGSYIVSAWGQTICDLYAMSNPLSASVRNGGTSYPIHFDDMTANAALIVAAVNERPALLARVAELEAALLPFVKVAEHDIGADETDEDQFQPFTSNYNRAPKLTVGDFRRARAALSTTDRGGA